MKNGDKVYIFSLEYGYDEVYIFNMGKDFIELKYRYCNNKIVRYVNNNIHHNLIEIWLNGQVDYYFPNYAVVSDNIGVLREYLLEMIND